MMEQLADIHYEKIEPNQEYSNLINRVVNECFKTEGLDKLKLYISITLTVPEVIQEANKKYRNIDKPTDVLSFPMFEKQELEAMLKKEVAVQADKQREQAEKAKKRSRRSFSREER